jgi:iron complex transport system substrate-binding protein
MRAVRRALLAALGAACCAAAAADLTLTDDRGRTVVLPRPAVRIVTLAPHLTEIAFAAGAGARLVGVSVRSDFPDAAKNLPVVSDAGRMDLERIAALKPDLVLAWTSGNPMRRIERLEQRGIAVLATDARRVEDVARLLRLVGLAAGTQADAERAARQYEERMLGLQARYSRLQPLRVFVEVWHEPLITVSGAHLISGVVRLCGGVNVFETTPRLTPAVSAEAVLAARPEVVIMSVGAGQADERAARWRRFPFLPAVQRGALYAVDPSLLERQGPRLADAAQALCESVALARKGLGRNG